MGAEPGQSVRYDAFISYSRSDRVFAERLEARLERYRAPKQVRRKDGEPLAADRLKIFRDMNDLGGTHLSREIEDELSASRFLIVLCSPDSCRDANGWIGKEIELYAKHHLRDGTLERDGIIPVLIGGRPNHEVGTTEPQDQAFHKSLYAYLEDPLAADFRSRPGESFRARRERHREALLHILAILFGTTKEELARRQQQRARRIYSGIVAFLVIVAIALAGLAFYAFNQRDRAVKAQQAEAAARRKAEDRLKSLCKALDEARVLADESNQGSVYYFQSEFAAIKEQCSTVDYKVWGASDP